VIADDERLMREQLRTRLAEVWPELQIVGEARNGQEAVDLVAAALPDPPDLVFLDIRMPGLTGIDAAREIAQLPVAEDAWLPEIVFLTAYDQYAVQAFEQGACDYILKPADRERLALTVRRLQQRLALRRQPPDAPAAAAAPAMASLQVLLHQLAGQLPLAQGGLATGGAGVAGGIGAAGGAAPTGAAQPGRAYLDWIQASVGAQIHMIPVAEVLFFISDEKYTRVQTPKVEALIRKPIKELVDELDPRIFWQIHRSTLVNCQAISAVMRDERGRQLVLLRDHAEKLEVSRSYSHLFKSM
jgi:DNA-binding LytR/AlgR family response regulator